MSTSPVEARGRLWGSSCELLYRVGICMSWRVRRQCVSAEPYWPESHVENTEACGRLSTSWSAKFRCYRLILRLLRPTRNKPNNTAICVQRSPRSQALTVQEANRRNGDTSHN